MPSTWQRTLAAPARVAGVAVHSGQPARLVVRPAPPDTGVVFRRSDLGDAARPIPARAERVCDTRLATVIGNDAGQTVATVEHLMAALAGLGIDNAAVEVDGPETPVMDGSAAEFVAALDAAGAVEQTAKRRFIEILEPIEVAASGKRAALRPADRFEMSVEIIFEAGAIGRQLLELALEPEVFRSELAAARTFGFIGEVEQLRAAGLGRGASLENTIVVDGERVLNPQAMGRPDDFVRHKALDALGDLALIGQPIIGRYEASCSGHALNNALVRAALDRPQAWRLIETQGAPA